MAMFGKRCESENDVPFNDKDGSQIGRRLALGGMALIALLVSGRKALSKEPICPQQNSNLTQGSVPQASFGRNYTCPTPFDFNVKGDGSTDDTVACQAFLRATAGKEAIFPSARYVTSSPLYISSGTTVRGGGPGSTIFINRTSQVFRNLGYENGSADTGIGISGVSFDGGGTGDTPISMIGVSDCVFNSLKIIGLRSDRVTVGIGIGATSLLPCRRISFNDIFIDVPDYGIVLDSGDGKGGLIQDVVISGVRVTIHWGSGISLARHVRDVAISNCIFHLAGDDEYRRGVGIGIKLWAGYDCSNAPSDVTITGCVFAGAPSHTGLFGISAANWTNNLTATGNTFRDLTYALYNNFGGELATNIAFLGNVVRSCDYGVVANKSTDSHISINSNIFTDILKTAIDAVLDASICSNNKFYNIGEAAIVARTSNISTICGNQFSKIGKEAIYMEKDGSKNSLCIINGNSFASCCFFADNKHAVIQLNDQSHTVTANTIRTELGGNLPSWIIGRRKGTNGCLISMNWMYGARQGYLQEGVHDNDQYIGNVQRGGIG